MRKAHLLALTGLFVSSIAFARYTPPTGFRDMAWGSSTASVPGGMTLKEDSGDSKCYERKEESLKIGDADLTSIGYCYYKDRLSFVVVAFDGLLNFSAIKEALIQKYETPYRPNPYMDKYWWGMDGKDVVISLDYSDISKKGTLSYMYKPLIDEETQDKKARAAGAANDL